MYQKFKNAEVGQQFYLKNPAYGRHQPEWSGPFPATKVTKTQITIDTGKEQKRFLKSDGRLHGSTSGWRSLQIVDVTDETTAKVKRDQEAAAKEKAEKIAAQRTKEAALRKKYNCSHIVADDIQSNWLAPLRKMAEQGKAKVAKQLKQFEGVSVDKGNYFHVARAMESSVKSGDMEYGTQLIERAEELHTDLCLMITDYCNGDRFECNGVEINDLDVLCRAKVQYAYDALCDRFFNWSFASQEIAAADQKFLSELRTMLGIQYSRKSVNKIKKEGDDNE